VAGLKAGRPWLDFWQLKSFFSVHHSVHSGSGTHPLVTGSFFPRVKSDHRVEVYLHAPYLFMFTCLSTGYVFMAWYLVKHKDNITFLHLYHLVLSSDRWNYWDTCKTAFEFIEYTEDELFCQFSVVISVWTETAFGAGINSGKMRQSSGVSPIWNHCTVVEVMKLCPVALWGSIKGRGGGGPWLGLLLRKDSSPGG
jgi:hypothetical protein